MNPKFQCATIAALCLLSVSCNNSGSKKPAAADMHTSSLSIDWEGIYSGVGPAADCPGLYKLVAIDSVQFDQLSKYLERDGVYLENGMLQQSGDTLYIDQVPYLIGEGMLYNSSDTLYRIGNDTHLPSVVKQQVMIENRKGGGKATMERNSNGKKPTVKFFFNGKEYDLTLNENNSQVNEYANGKTTLELETIDPAPQPDEVMTPIFNDGVHQYEFTLVPPPNKLYEATEGDDYFDVVYFDGAKQGAVLLLNDDSNDCYLLYRTQAENKSTTYSNGTIRWTIHGDKATLTAGNHTKTFTQSKSNKK